jgi:hypothetical protein
VTTEQSPTEPYSDEELDAGISRDKRLADFRALIERGMSVEPGYDESVWVGGGCRMAEPNDALRARVDWLLLCRSRCGSRAPAPRGGVRPGRR